MRALTLLAAVVTALVLPIPSAAAAPEGPTGDPFPFPCFFAPSPGSGWKPVRSDYFTCQQCETAAEAGVARGDWEQYHCAFVSTGLDGSYWLFVPETRATPAS